jgi:hypothetical protein
LQFPEMAVSSSSSGGGGESRSSGGRLGHSPRSGAGGAGMMGGALASSPIPGSPAAAAAAMYGGAYGGQVRWMLLHVASAGCPAARCFLLPDCHPCCRVATAPLPHPHSCLLCLFPLFACRWLALP